MPLGKISHWSGNHAKVNHIYPAADQAIDKRFMQFILYGLASIPTMHCFTLRCKSSFAKPFAMKSIEPAFSSFSLTCPLSHMPEHCFSSTA